MNKTIIGYAVTVALGLSLITTGADSLVRMFNSLQGFIEKQAMEITGGEFVLELPRLEFNAEEVIAEYESVQ